MGVRTLSCCPGDARRSCELVSGYGELGLGFAGRVVQGG